MIEAKMAAEWKHTSCLLAMLYNVNRGPNSPALEASDFDPFVVREKPARQVKAGMLARALGVKRPKGKAPPPELIAKVRADQDKVHGGKGT
jgi:hypothetical protein